MEISRKCSLTKNEIWEEKDINVNKPNQSESDVHRCDIIDQHQHGR